jgi:Phage integrase family
MAGRALTPEEVVRLINAPDRSKAEGARDHALLLVLARTSLRVSEVRNLRVSSIVWSHGRWTARVKVKGGRERTIPFPKDVKQAIDHYLKLDAGRQQHLHSDGDDAFIFQPIVNYRTLEFDKALSARHICQIGVALPFRNFLPLALQKCRLCVSPRKSQCLQGLSTVRNRQSIGRQHADKLARQSSQVEPASQMPMNKDDSRGVQNCLA